ncbi:Coenzyme F420 hydrogenase/dehydrogenase, beta subunit C-terminal domain [Methanooceanicella nereidis]|nr:Coenzyme F420 hydrogenase/dehydrogenase, beta subunit C-terminal domain [Methanocella sp. CWC-04]
MNVRAIRDGSCTGCGTCAAFCHKGAIRLNIDEARGVYYPNVSENSCDECGICLKVCPGNDADLYSLNEQVSGKKQMDVFIGNYLNCYTGYSNDEKTRSDSTSGGLVTGLLIYALESGIIDGALVTRMSRTDQLIPEPFIARTKEDIIDASGSKYCPVPLNALLKEVISSKKGEKFAVVGLPCHIHGMKKASSVFKELNDKIVLYIGLFCNHTPNFFALPSILDRMNIKKDDITKINYRHNGWPGFITVTAAEKEYKIPFSDGWSIMGSYLFYPKRCLLCSDGLAELSDISFGDAWLPEYMKDKAGTSIAISRSDKADYLINKMSASGRITIGRIDAEKVAVSQKIMLYLKKKNINSRIRLLKSDMSCDNVLSPGPVDYALALYPVICHKLSRRKFTKYLPVKAIKAMEYVHLRLCNLRARSILHHRNDD